MNFQLKNILLTTAIISTLSGCSGGSGSAAGTATAPASADTGGQVINSYISGATVTLDINDDGICDASEPQVTTSITGNYSFTATGTHLVCATGGTNSVTGLPFVGRLTAPAGATVVTPLTSLVVAQVLSNLPAPALGKPAPLDPTAVAAAQAKIMAQLSLPASAPILSTDPVALMTKVGATAADAKLEQTNAAVQVLLQHVAQSIIGSADLPAAPSAAATNEAFNAAVSALQTVLNTVGGTQIDLTAATTASTGQLINTVAIKAAATVKANQVLLGVSASFGTISPASVAAAIAATPLAELVNAVAGASAASLTTKGGAESVASSAPQLAAVVQQIAPLLTDNADAGAVSMAALTTLIKTLLPSTGSAPTQAVAEAAISSAIAIINAALPAGRVALKPPVITVQQPVTIPKN